MNPFSDFLFARPSFLEGLARLMDSSGSLNTYNESPDGKVADARAMAADWRVVGDDLRTAIDLMGDPEPDRVKTSR